MKFVNLNSAFLIGVMAVSLGGCASNGDESAEQSGMSKIGATTQLVTSEAQSEFETALKALDDKDYKKAEKLLIAMTIKHPTLSGPYLNLGLLYIQQDKNDKALVALQKAVEINPNNIDAYNQLAWVYREKADFAKAEETYLQGLVQNSKDAELNYNLGILYDLILQNPKKALYYYEQYLENTSGDDKQVEMWVKDLQRRT